jgi:glycosyltransferase involved in cell wall biosynthesis
MHIALVAPLMEPVPPRLYGGTERVVSLLTEELVRRGHAVTLFASEDSQTAAELVPCCRCGLRLDPSVTDTVAYLVTELGAVERRAAEFDVIHSHVDYLAFPTARLSPTPLLSTCHGRLDLPEIQRVYRDFPEQPLVAISDDQRTYLPTANWMRTVYNAVDLTAYHFRPDPGDYLVFLGRICPEKRPDRAIEIARDVGMRLVIAAKIDPVDAEYWSHAIEPMVRANPSLIEYIGEVDERGKDELLGGAWAYLFPIDWPEPFGLTMVEAMATGTPVIAYRAGSVPEVVEHGVTGFICDSLSDMIAGVNQVGALDRAACRRRVERLFSPATMADGYERAYATVIAQGRNRRPATHRIQWNTLPPDHRMSLAVAGEAWIATRPANLPRCVSVRREANAPSPLPIWGDFSNDSAGLSE